MADAAFVGRTIERDGLEALVAGATDRGAARLVLGGPGIGKTTLVDAVAATAPGRVLRTTGVPSESQLPFAGLHQLLLPVLDLARDLPVLLAAVGRLDAEVGEAVEVALATLSLLREVAASAPLLLVVEDVHWLDRLSVDALAFVARRLDDDPIVLLATARPVPLGSFDDAGLERLELRPLDDDEAAALIDATEPGLDPALHRRLLAEAQGNPLALVELARAWRQRPPGPLLAAPVPVTDRLRAAFGHRLGALPPATRTALLVAGLDADATVDEVLAATAALEGGQPDDALGPALADGLIEIDGLRLSFRHPLVRSAVHDDADPARLRAAHAALGAALDEPDRAVWHRAAALTGTDDEVANALDGAGRRARRRGALPVAVAALERAAMLTSDPARRGSRLVDAADLAVDLGRTDLVAQLLDQADALPLTTVDRARSSWRRRLLDRGVWRDPDQIRELVKVIDEMPADAAIDALTTASVFCWWTDLDDARRHLVVETVDRVEGPPDDPRRLAILGMTAPIDRGREVAERLQGIAPGAATDPASRLFLGSVSGAVGHPVLASAFLDDAIPAMRAQGLFSLLSSALTARAYTAWYLGDLRRAATFAAEGGRLAAQSGRPTNHAMARLVEGSLAAIRGDTAAATMIVDEAEHLCRPLGAKPILDLAGAVTVLAALTDGRADQAYERAAELFPAGRSSASVAVNQGAVTLFADAAAEAGRVEEGRQVIEEIAELAERAANPSLRASVRYGRARLDPSDERFADALESDLATWTFSHARLQLAHGAWLRRVRRIADSRAPLRAARNALDELGASAWAERARQELRATGEVTRAPEPGAVDQLTPQELEIARLAAEGLTNREIGQRLFLSHRTVGSHLSHVYPKLGIRSRVGLAKALDG